MKFQQDMKKNFFIPQLKECRFPETEEIGKICSCNIY